MVNQQVELLKVPNMSIKCEIFELVKSSIFRPRFIDFYFFCYVNSNIKSQPKPRQVNASDISPQSPKITVKLV